MPRWLPLIAICSLLLLVPEVGWAQELDAVLEEHNRERLQLNNRGMVVLMGWAAANMTAGTAGWFLAEDERWRSFHQMNILWNTVNATIGIFGYLGNRGTDPGSLDLATTIQESYGMERLLALNIGLDVGYMAFGAFMWERGLRKDSARWTGWGQSLIVQGGFLFAFDIALLAFNASLDSDLMMRIQSMGQGGMGLGLGGQF